MEDKSISRKRLNVYKKKHLSKKKRLYKTETIECCYLSTYNPLSRNFNNITMWLNLTFVNISSSMITILPSAFGKLHLNSLDLSQNCLGTFNLTRWPWIEQSAVRNTLCFLDISNNTLTKLPFNIDRLDALTYLVISHNMLRSLPQSIGYVQNLKILDLSYNKLLCLPISLFLLQLEYLDIRMNPFRIQEYEQNNEQNNVQSLVILSANIVLQHSIPYDTILPPALVKFLAKAEHCSVCGRVCMDFLRSYEIYPTWTIANYVKSTSENHSIQFVSYFCSSSC